MRTWSSKTIVEGIGLLAVVFSLIFVGLELRQNSATVRMEARQAYISDISESTRQYAYDPYFSELISRANLSPETLEEFEVSRLRAFFTSEVYLRFGIFQSVNDGILPSDYLGLVARGRVFHSPYFKEVWPNSRTGFPDDFVEYFESQDWNL